MERYVFILFPILIISTAAWGYVKDFNGRFIKNPSGVEKGQVCPVYLAEGKPYRQNFNSDQAYKKAIESWEKENRDHPYTMFAGVKSDVDPTFSRNQESLPMCDAFSCVDVVCAELKRLGAWKSESQCSVLDAVINVYHAYNYTSDSGEKRPKTARYTDNTIESLLFHRPNCDDVLKFAQTKGFCPESEFRSQLPSRGDDDEDASSNYLALAQELPAEDVATQGYCKTCGEFAPHLSRNDLSRIAHRAGGIQDAEKRAFALISETDKMACPDNKRVKLPERAPGSKETYHMVNLSFDPKKGLEEVRKLDHLGDSKWFDEHNVTVDMNYYNFIAYVQKGYPVSVTLKETKFLLGPKQTAEVERSERRILERLLAKQKRGETLTPRDEDKMKNIRNGTGLHVVTLMGGWIYDIEGGDNRCYFSLKNSWGNYCKDDPNFDKEGVRVCDKDTGAVAFSVKEFFEHATSAQYLER